MTRYLMLVECLYLVFVRTTLYNNHHTFMTMIFVILLNYCDFV